MEYKVIYRPYTLSRLIEQATGDKGGSYADKEAGDWTEAINKYAKVGWIVKNSGIINSGRDVVFWALMEKT